MANIAHFEIPADDVDRATRFYHSLLGWKIEPTKVPMDPAAVALMQYQDIVTGEASEGTLSTGGLYKRQIPGTHIITWVMVEDIDRVLAKVEKLGGRITLPKMEIPSVRADCDHRGHRRKRYRHLETRDEERRSITKKTCSVLV